LFAGGVDVGAAREGGAVAGEADFTPDEWLTMRRAVAAAGVIVSLAEGGGDDVLSEVFAITQHLRRARMGHENRLIRELANMQNFGTGLRPGMRPAEYEGPALEAIRAAAACVVARSPADAAAFRTFLVELGEAAANAHREGGLAGVGGIRVTAAEAAAIARIRRAAGLP
jgi:hypothetical protein